MDTKQILAIIGSDEKLQQLCLGVFPCDKLPSIERLPCCFIANTDTSRQPGSHWVAFYIDHEGNVEYFDTFGRPPSSNRFFKKYLGCEPVVWSMRQVQSSFSTTCGQHCCVFALCRSRGNTFRSVAEMYGQDLEANDKIVCDFINDRFDFNLPRLDDNLVLNQVCCALHPYGICFTE